MQQLKQMIANSALSMKILNDQSFEVIFLYLGVYPTEKLLQMCKQC